MLSCVVGWPLAWFLGRARTRARAAIAKINRTAGWHCLGRGFRLARGRVNVLLDLLHELEVLLLEDGAVGEDGRYEPIKVLVGPAVQAGHMLCQLNECMLNDWMRIHTRAHTNTHTRTRTRTRARTHAPARARGHTHTHTHTHARARAAPEITAGHKLLPADGAASVA